MKLVWANASGALVSFVVVYLTVLLFQDHPVTAYSRNYEPLNVYPGQTVHVRAEIERSATCTSDVLVQWIDQQGNLLEEQRYPGGLLKAGKEVFESDRKVPLSTPEGVLRLRVRTEFYCNWLQMALKMGSFFIMPDVIFEVSRKDPE